MSAADTAATRFDALADGTLRAWPAVASCLLAGAYLAGGTALALRLAHRRSYDLDVLCRRTIDTSHLVGALRAALADTTGLTIDIVSPTRVAARTADTRIDYTVDPSPLISEAATVRGMPVAGIDDITAMKVAAVTDRGALRDWYDLMMIQRTLGLTHRECFLLYRERFGAPSGPAGAALVADRLCKWLPATGELAPDPHLVDISGLHVQDDTRTYWRRQQPEVNRQLSMYKRRSERTGPPGIGPRTTGRPSPRLEPGEGPVPL